MLVEVDLGLLVLIAGLLERESAALVLTPVSRTVDPAQAQISLALAPGLPSFSY